MTKLSKAIFVTTALLFVAGCSSTERNIIGVSDSEEPKISYCLPRYISEPETRTIYEVFTGEEMTYGHLIMRSQLKKRAGMYFFVMFGYTPDDIAMGCRFVLEVDSNKTSQVRKFVFDVPKTTSVLREVKLGLTGSDWKRDEKVNAWRLTLFSPSGKILTQSQSWLWDIEKGITRLDKKDTAAIQTELLKAAEKAPLKK